MAVSPSPFLRLRRAIDKHIKTTAGLDAFFIHFFPHIAREISPAMERMAKVNLLFTYEKAPDIQRALEQQLSEDEEALAELRADLGAIATPAPTALRPRPAAGPGESPRLAMATPPPAPRDQLPPLIFIEYADADLGLVNELMLQLGSLVRARRLRVFARRQLEPGADWKMATAAQLAQAAVVLLLISPDLLASDGLADFLYETQQLVGARIIPLLARPALWEQSPLVGLTPLPADRRFLSSLGRSERELALVEIAEWLMRRVAARAD